MSLFGRAVGAVGTAGVQITNKYIDEQLYAQRAQMLADLQRTSTNLAREDQYNFENDPTRVAAGRERKVQDAVAANDPRIVSSGVAAKNAITTGTSAADAAAAGAKKKAEDENTTRDVAPGGQLWRGGTKTAENTRPTGAEVSKYAYDEGLKGATDKLPEPVKIQLGSLREQIKEIETEINKGVAGGGLATKPSEKNPNADEAYQFLLKKKRALEIQFSDLVRKHTDGGGAAADPAGLRGGGGGTAPAGKGKLELIADAAKANGDTDFNIDVDGVKSAVGSPKKPEAPGLLARAKAAVAGSAGAPEYVAPPDSVVGKARARAAEDAAAKEQATAQQRQQAAQAYAALQPGDKAGAFRLQSSALFGLLTPEQQKDVYARVNGR